MRSKMSSKLPEGVTQEEIPRTIDRYDNLTEAQAVAEIEAVMSDSDYIEVLIPRAIADKVVRLSQRYEDHQDGAFERPIEANAK
jgi:hypothetical protein